MPQINQLSALGQVSSGDQLPVYTPTNGDARRMSIAQLLTYFQQNFASPNVSANLYVPTTGFNIAVPSPPAEQQWLILQPVGTLATGTITLPLNTQTADGAEILITSTQQITALSFSLNGATAIFGAPTGLTLGTGCRLRYFKTTNTWYSISAQTNFLVNPNIGNATGTSLILTGQLTAGAGASITGATSTTTLATSGAATVGGTLGVTGTATLSGNATVGGTLGVTGTATLSGNATVGGTLGITGATTATGAITCKSNILIDSAGVVGYTTGAGGTVSQAIAGSKAAGVTLNKQSGTIVLDPTGAVNAGATVTFTLTNSFIGQTDVVIVNANGGTSGAYNVSCRVASGSCDINVTNVTGGNLTESLNIVFAVINGAIS